MCTHLSPWKFIDGSNDMLAQVLRSDSANVPGMALIGEQPCGCSVDVHMFIRGCSYPMEHAHSDQLMHRLFSWPLRIDSRSLRDMDVVPEGHRSRGSLKCLQGFRCQPCRHFAAERGCSDRLQCLHCHCRRPCNKSNKHRRRARQRNE